MTDRVTITEAEGVATVTLSRPDKRNALDLKMLTAIAQAGETLKTRRDIRCVVLTGAGPAFCAGLDTSIFQEFLGQDPASNPLAQRSYGQSNLFQYVAMVWSELPMPVVAALHGFAFGGGFQIMLGADIRVAHPDTKFSIMEGKWGLIPDMGGMVLMPRLARGDIIRRLTYTAETFDGTAAQNWGFVTELSDKPFERAQALAQEIAGRSPDAVRMAKKLIQETALTSPAKTLISETEAQLAIMGKHNQFEAVMAGMQKRPPIFKD